MTKREHAQITKAMSHFMEDEPRDEGEATVFGGFLAGMDILDDMMIANCRRLKRLKSKGHK